MPLLSKISTYLELEIEQQCYISCTKFTYSMQSFFVQNSINIYQDFQKPFEAIYVVFGTFLNNINVCSNPNLKGLLSMYSESVCLKELIESGSESNFSSQYPMRKALDIHCNKLSSNIFWSLSKKNQHTTSEVLKCFLDYLFTSNYKNLLQYILCNVTESKQHTYATFCLVRLQPQPQEYLYLEPTLC